MDLTSTKWVVLVILFVATFLFSMFPLKLMAVIRNTRELGRRLRYSQGISLLSCFAAGVFMGTGLLDLYPEVTHLLSRENLAVYTNSSFPIPEFTVAYGFLLVLILEQIVQEFTVQGHRLVESEHSSASEIQPSERAAERQVISESDDEQSGESGLHPKLRSFVLLMALSLHSLLEGIAIGLQPDVSSLIQIFAAVVLHKVVLAFSLGLNLVQSSLSLPAIIKSNILFSVTSPIGIAIAMIIEQFCNCFDSWFVNGVLEGLACGSFVYVTFFEVLPHELKQADNRMMKLLMLLFGFSLVCCILFLNPENSASQIS